MVVLNITTEDKVLNGSITSSGYEVGNFVWDFGDDTAHEYTATVTHTYANYGVYTVTIRYTEYVGSLPTKTLTRTVTISKSSPDDPDEIEGDLILDAFKSKPIIIPADCTGNIKVTAVVEELETPANNDTSSMSSSIGAYANFASIALPAYGDITLSFAYDSATTDFTNVVCSDASFENLGNIPAFYNSGQLNIQYTLGSSDDANGAFDLKWDLLMSFPDAQTLCPWSEGNYATNSQIMKNLITSDNSEINLSNAAEYTTMIQTFNINSWSQIPPFVIKEFIDEPATTIMVKRAMLANPEFHIKITNNLSSAVTINNAACKFNFSFNPTSIFMNMRTEGDRRQKQSRIYTLPKGAEVTRLDSLDFPIYAVVDGYKVGTSTRAAEIVKVYATWNEYNTTGDYYFPTTIELLPVEGMSGTDYPTCLYKSAEGVMKRADFIRITDGGWMNGDGITVLDAPTIAASEHYRTINVKVQSPSGYDGYNPDAQDAAFIIDTTPNTNVDDAIDEETLAANIDKVHFFNVTKPFASSVSINRSEIEPTFYETLWQTYDKAVVLESVVEEPLYYVKFSVNNYPKTIPIYNNNTVMFSDSLSHAADGVRSGDVWVMDGVTPNIINIQCPTKHKYKVKFLVKYDVYKHMYVITDEDIPAGYL